MTAYVKAATKFKAKVVEKCNRRGATFGKTFENDL
jgi:hypothetical protein